jgi:putative ABC transport system permease protein
LEVVGIAGPVTSTIFGTSAEPHMYVPFGQHYQSDMQIHLKVSAQTADAELRILDTVRREIRAVDERLPLLALKTMRTHLDSSAELWSVRTGARMFGLFGAVAMLLAVIGLYGVKAYTVARRTREIGVRMALGATSEETLRMILSEGFKLTLVGVGIGFLLALGLGKLLSGFLYEVSAFDPLVLSVAPLFLTITSLVACYIPARRAAKVDPIVALRYE